MFNPTPESYAHKLLPVLMSPDLDSPDLNGVILYQRGEPVAPSPVMGDGKFIASNWAKLNALLDLRGSHWRRTAVAAALPVPAPVAEAIAMRVVVVVVVVTRLKQARQPKIAVRPAVTLSVALTAGLGLPVGLPAGLVLGLHHDLDWRAQ